MSIRVETGRVRTESYRTVKTTVVTMPEVDYKMYHRSKFMLGPVRATCMLTGFPGCAAALIGGMYFAGFILHFSKMGSMGFGFLLALIISGGALCLGQYLEKKHIRIREELLEKHGLKYDTWERRWPRYRVELEKSAK